jgi:hypothetical protein
MVFGVLLPLFGFGGLAEGVWNRGGLGWDTAVLQLLHQHDSAGLDRVAIDVSPMGDIRLVIFFTVAIAIILLVRQRYREERFLANCVVGAAATIFLVKAALRPVVLLRLAGPPVAARRVLLGLLASLAAVLGGYIASDLAHDNLRIVLPGQAYRAGQMSPNALALSMWNGHVPLLRPSVSAMDHSFWRYVSNRVSRAQAEAAPGK